MRDVRQPVPPPAGLEAVPELLGLMLSSQYERAGDPDWLSIGSGVWDRHRPARVRVGPLLGHQATVSIHTTVSGDPSRRVSGVVE
jgi:hypothetical protein